MRPAQVAVGISAICYQPKRPHFAQFLCLRAGKFKTLPKLTALLTRFFGAIEISVSCVFGKKPDLNLVPFGGSTAGLGHVFTTSWSMNSSRNILKFKKKLEYKYYVTL